MKRVAQNLKRSKHSRSTLETRYTVRLTDIQSKKLANRTVLNVFCRTPFKRWWSCFQWVLGSNMSSLKAGANGPTIQSWTIGSKM